MSSGVAQRSSAGMPLSRAKSASARARSTLLDHALPYALLLLTVVAVAVPFWPGRMNADTLVEIAQLKTALYTSQYSPILEAMWRPFFTAGFGPGWILIGQVVVFELGAFLILRLAFKPLGAALATAFISITPMVFGGLGLVGRDMWFQALLIACFAAVARAFATAGRVRRVWIAIALTAAWLTLATRQNAPASVFVPLALLAGMWLVDRWPTIVQRRRALASLALVLGLIFTLVMMGSQVLVTRAIGLRPFSAAAPLFIYDLAMLSRADGKNYFPPTVVADRSMRTIDARTNVDNIVPMIVPDGPIPLPGVGPGTAAIRTAWERRVIAEPFQYLRERVALMLDETALTNDSIWVYHPYIDPNKFGYHTTFPWANRVVNSYMRTFTDGDNNGDFLFAVWAYLLLCAFVAAQLLRARSWKRILVGAFALSALSYQLSLLFGLMGSNYRYEAPAVAIALITLALAAGHLWDRRRVALEPRRRFARRIVSAGG